MSPVEELETGSIIDLLQAEKRYKEEREKRLRPDTKDQFIDICLDDRFKTFLEDPWIDMDGSAVKDASTMFPNNRCQLLIVGAGWGGILYAIRMIQAGIDADGIRIVDIAGGFGGTWYWNRYPGLTCDTESYSYLPLLEETGYIPQHRYSSGEEIRNYAKLVAQKWGLKDKSIFQTKAEKLNWDEHLKQWRVALVQQREAKEPLKLEVYAQFVAAVNGVLNWPKLPAIPGIFDYRGNLFHSSRWDYDVTGGSPTDPSLSKLQEQRVAIIGTGGTAIQSIPYLARWAKHLYVVQRTPSGVDERNQRETSTEWFRNEVAKVPGWQRERLRNFHQHFTTEEPPAINLIDDGWSRARGMAVVAGNPNGPRKMEELPAYIKKVYAIDLPRQERIRKRVGEVVKDPILAKRLQAWYPTVRSRLLNSINVHRRVLINFPVV